MSIHFKINNIEVEAEAGELLLNVAKRYDIDIPSLCHNDKVKCYGACGVCVVENAKGGIIYDGLFGASNPNEN